MSQNNKDNVPQDQNGKKQRKELPRQQWKPHWALDAAYKVWQVVFSAAKIAAGAALTVLVIGVVCLFAFAQTLGDYLQEDIIPASDMVLGAVEQDRPSYIYYTDEDGQIQLLQRIYASTSWEKAEYEDIPTYLINAAIAIEDKRFYEHQGVDWFTTIKACANMFFGDSTIGGSSITQQLVKNETTEDSVTVQRKVMEIFRATSLERRYDKKIIMEEYLNTIYLGQGCRGVRAAAETYFGKELEKLTLAECASLISITNNPSLFNPYDTDVFEYAGEMMDGMERNQHRQRLVLGEMLSQGWITQEEYDEAVDQKLVLKNGVDEMDRLAVCPNQGCGYKDTLSTFKAVEAGYLCPKCNTQIEVETDSSQEVYSWYVETVIEDVAMYMAQADGITEWNDDISAIYKDRIARGGYHIYSCIDMEVQAAMDRIYTDLDQVPDTRSGQQMQSAMVIIDNETGDISGICGGVDEKVDFDAFNRATDSKLQSGSAIKPLSIYAPGFELGIISPATVVSDVPFRYEADGTVFPRNDNNKYNYSRTILSAVRSSVNACATFALDMVTTDIGYEFAKEKFGLTTLTDHYENSSGKISSDIDFAPLAMGAQTVGVTVRDMANAYATFANNGVWREARTYSKVYNSDGELVIDNVQDYKTILGEKTVNYMNYCLVSAASGGTGWAATSNIRDTEIAGKTGSTSSYRDRWFCAFSGYYTGAVWCGYDTPEVITVIDGSGSHPAVTMWWRVMKPLHQGVENIQLYDRNKFTWTTVCLDSGKRATEACGNDIRLLLVDDDDFTRTETVRVYPEDVTGGSCSVHVSVDYCVTGGGVCTEWCHKFAEVDPEVKIEKRSLVKMTQKQVDELKKAQRYKLNPEYLMDEYVYLVDSSGKDASWKGFDGDINKNINAPYKVCTAHTEAAWKTYQSSLPTEPDPTDPNAPTQPGTTPETGTVTPPAPETTTP